MDHERDTDLQRARQLAESVDHWIEEDAAALADVKIETLEAWRKRGTGPAWTRWGNRVMYARASIRDFLFEKARTPSSSSGKAAL